MDTDLLPLDQPDGNAFIRGFVRLGQEKRPVLHLPAVLETLPKRKGNAT